MSSGSWAAMGTAEAPPVELVDGSQSEELFSWFRQAEIVVVASIAAGCICSILCSSRVVEETAKMVPGGRAIVDGLDEVKIAASFVASEAKQSANSSVSLLTHAVLACERFCCLRISFTFAPSIV